MSEFSPLHVVQLTDLHLFAHAEETLLGLPTYASLQAVIQRLSQVHFPLEVILLTGDLSQDGSQASYAQVAELLAPLDTPTYWLPGNHDDLSAIATVLRQPPILPEKSFQKGGWQFLLLNSAVPGEVYGELSSASLTWLEAQLQQSQLPTLVALHHPPFLVNSHWLDTSRLKNSDQFLEIVDRYPQVKLVICGHIHQEFTYRRQQTLYLSAPATCVQFAPESQQFALDQVQPGFRIFQLYPDGTFTTQVERVELACKLDQTASCY